MTIYRVGQLPFWASNDEKKKLVYRLPNSITVKKKNREAVDKVASEIGLKVSLVNLGGFDGNGNHWKGVSDEKN